MRTIRRCFLLTILVLLLIPMEVRAQLPSNNLEGTWKMVSRELVYPDSVVDQSDDWGPGFKILNSTHFAWGRETKDGSEVLAGGGWYEYHPEKNVYIEHIQYHSEPAFVGQSIRFTARVEGDTWYHIGELGDFKLREVWKRVDPQSVKQKISGMGAAQSEASSGGGQ